MRCAFPFIRELPFIAAFMYMMGAMDTFKSFCFSIAAGQFMTLGLMCMRHLSIWFAGAFVAACMLCLVSCKRIRMSIRLLFYALALIAFTTRQFLSINFNTVISPTIVTMVAETTTREATEFAHNYCANPLTIALYCRCGLMVAIFALLEVVYRRFLHRIVARCEYLIGFIVISLLGFALFSFSIFSPLFSSGSLERTRAEILRVEGTSRDLPNDPITQLLRSIVMLNKAGEAMKRAVEVSKKLSNQDILMTDSVDVILVIGESYIKSHSQLYGYYLQTTPRLEALRDSDELFVFNDVVAPDNSTSFTLKNMLCCNSIGDGEQWYDSPFVPAIFKYAGYDVYFWDNQRDFDKTAEYSFSLNSFLYHHDMLDVYKEMNRESFQYDGDLIESFWASTEIKESANLIIFHLVGQHIDAATRYPHTPQFSRFCKNDVNRDECYITNQAIQRIVDYDNATFYNDDVLAQVIDGFKSRDAVLVYLSDHGEEVYDYRDHYGRDHNRVITDSCAKYEYEIPFVIWCSKRYKNRHPAIVQAIKESVNKPFMSDNLCHLLFCLAGINTKYYVESRNLLSPDYSCPPRIIGERADYDKLIKRK